MSDEMPLDIGWALENDDHPRFWHGNPNGPVSRAVAERRHLVEVRKDALDTHMVIIAQSGSGKSFFLGRLIEELVLKTQSRCLVLDPNSDYRSLADIDEKPWKKPIAYTPSSRFGWLPTESSKEECQALWEQCRVLVRSARAPDGRRSLLINWPLLPGEALSRELPAPRRGLLHDCHEFVSTLAKLMSWRGEVGAAGSINHAISMESVFDEAHRLLSRDNEINLAAHLSDHFTDSTLRDRLRAVNRASDEEIDFTFNRKVGPYKATLSTLRPAIPPDIAEYYLAEGRRLLRFGSLSRFTYRLFAPADGADAPHVEVLDLPSVRDRGQRLLVVGSALTSEVALARRAWEHALNVDKDERVPKFIVVDEAHNLIPSGPQEGASDALRETFRTIAAEGRKFGLFLILVTQRPDKVDERVLSECGNHVLMRVQSETLLRDTCTALGLEDHIKALRRCTKLPKGCGALTGTWAPLDASRTRTPAFFYSCARRTKEGGRNLDAAHWTVARARETVTGEPDGGPA